MAMAILESAFHWQCEECGIGQFIKAKVGELCEGEAATIDEHYQTVDATGEGEQKESEYLVAKVVVGPAFVQCEKCGKMHATALPME